MSEGDFDTDSVEEPEGGGAEPDFRTFDPEDGRPLPFQIPTLSKRLTTTAMVERNLPS